MTLAPAEAAEELGISLATFWRLVRKGELPTVKASDPDRPGRRPTTRISKDDLQAFIDARTRAVS